MYSHTLSYYSFLFFLLPVLLLIKMYSIVNHPHTRYIHIPYVYICRHVFVYVPICLGIIKIRVLGETHTASVM